MLLLFRNRALLGGSFSVFLGGISTSKISSCEAIEALLMWLVDSKCYLRVILRGFERFYVIWLVDALWRIWQWDGLRAQCYSSMTRRANTIATCKPNRNHIVRNVWIGCERIFVFYMKIWHFLFSTKWYTGSNYVAWERVGKWKLIFQRGRLPETNAGDNLSRLEIVNGYKWYGWGSELPQINCPSNSHRTSSSRHKIIALPFSFPFPSLL